MGMCLNLVEYIGIFEQFMYFFPQHEYVINDNTMALTYCVEDRQDAQVIVRILMVNKWKMKRLPVSSLRLEDKTVKHKFISLLIVLNHVI